MDLVFLFLAIDVPAFKFIHFQLVDRPARNSCPLMILYSRSVRIDVCINGSSNAALLAAQILGLNDLELQERIYKRRKKISEIIEKESEVNE